MSDELTADAVEGAIADVTHPEIDATLVELGMIDDVRVDGDEVTIDLAIPMAGIPDGIKRLLAERLGEGIETMPFDPDVTVQFVVMDDETRERFFQMEEEHWAGLDGEGGEPPEKPF
jgi:ATP-binding protein involved in chromosome partitioning